MKRKMKGEEMSAEAWDQTVRMVLGSPQFREAWEEVGECGLGGFENGRYIWDLIQESEFHVAKLQEGALEIMKICDKYLHPRESKPAPTDQDLASWDREVTRQITVMATAYFIVGAMVGSLSAIKKLRPETPQLVN